MMLVLVAAIAASRAPAAQRDPKLRPMTVEDMLQNRELGTIAQSLDGALVSAVVRHPPAPTDQSRRTDVWILAPEGLAPRSITTELSQSGLPWPQSWAPWSMAWSQDGHYLALSRDYLYVWDRAHAALKRLSDRAVVPGTTVEIEDGAGAPIAWLNDRTLVALLQPSGPLIDNTTKGMAPMLWRRTQAGREAAASALEVQNGVPSRELTLGSVTLVDVPGGAVTELAQLPLYEFGTRQLVPSPDRRWLAVLADLGPTRMRPDRPLGWNNRWRSRLGFASLTQAQPIRWVEGGPFQRILGWSPDGSQLCVLGREDEWAMRPEKILIVRRDSSTAERLGTPDLKFSNVADDYRWTATASLVWTSDNRPVLYAHRVRAADTPAVSRSDWWRLEPDGAMTNLTSPAEKVPRRLQPTGNRNRYFGLADDVILELDVATGRRAELRQAVRTIAWPPTTFRPREPLTHVVLQTRSDDQTIFSRVGLSSGLKPEELVRLNGEVTLEAYGSASGVGVAKQVAPGETALWLFRSGAPPAKLTALNTHVANVADAERISVEYRSADGAPMKALALLPPDYQRGKRYPTIVQPWEEVRLRDTAAFFLGKQSSSFLNLQLLPARGYVLLLAGVTVRGINSRTDPLVDVPNGVMPAVDRLIELGIADPARLGVMGLSYGGQMTYLLLARTDRFKAAVAISGPADTLSLYGQFDPRFRYTDFPHEYFVQGMALEGGWLGAGGSPWSDLWVYLRNNPISYLDRVKTPVLIAQGDQDYVSMSQGEQYFSGLYRLGRTARFVRYWGEGHVLESPANVQHLWNEIFSWFDRHLAPSASEEGRGASR